MRLNFQGAIAGLGRGLSTLGQQGIEEQQRVAADQRLTQRQMAINALERAQHEQDRANAPADYEAMTKPVLHRAQLESELVRIPERRVEGEITQEVADHNSARDFQEQMRLLTTRDRLDFQQWRQRHGIEQADQRSLEQWREANGIGPDANRVPQQRRNGTTGNYDEYRNGAWVDTGVRFPTRPDPGANDGSGDPPPDGVPTERVRAATERIRRATEGRGGRPVLTPRPAAAGDARAAAMAELGTVYGNATPERYPGLFRNGRKIPLAEARRILESRYPE